MGFVLDESLLADSSGHILVW